MRRERASELVRLLGDVPLFMSECWAGRSWHSTDSLELSLATVPAVKGSDGQCEGSDEDESVAQCTITYCSVAGCPLSPGAGHRPNGCQPCGVEVEGRYRHWQAAWLRAGAVDPAQTEQRVNSRARRKCDRTEWTEGEAPSCPPLSSPSNAEDFKALLRQCRGRGRRGRRQQLLRQVRQGVCCTVYASTSSPPSPLCPPSTALCPGVRCPLQLLLCAADVSHCPTAHSTPLLSTLQRRARSAVPTPPTSLLHHSSAHPQSCQRYLYPSSSPTPAVRER